MNSLAVTTQCLYIKFKINMSTEKLEVFIQDLNVDP